MCVLFHLMHSLSLSLVYTFIVPKIPALLAAPLLGAVAAATDMTYGQSSTHAPFSEHCSLAESLGGGVQPAEDPYPLVVFSHGLGAMRAFSSAICCDLASHGYVVAAVEHRYMCVCMCIVCMYVYISVWVCVGVWVGEGVW